MPSPLGRSGEGEREARGRVLKTKAKLNRCRCASYKRFLGMAIDPQGDLATIGLARGANRIGGVVFGFDSFPMRHAR